MKRSRCPDCGNVYEPGIIDMGCRVCQQREQQFELAHAQAVHGRRAAQAAERGAEAQVAAAREQRRMAEEERRRMGNYDAAAGTLHRCLVEIELIEDESTDDDPHARLLQVKSLERTVANISAEHVDPNQRQDLARAAARLLKLKKKLCNRLGDDAEALDRWLALTTERQARSAYVANHLASLAQARSRRGVAVHPPASLDEARAQLVDLTAYHQTWVSATPAPPDGVDGQTYARLLNHSHETQHGRVFMGLGPVAVTLDGAVPAAESGFRYLRLRSADRTTSMIDSFLGLFGGDKKLTAIRDVGWLHTLWLQRLAIIEQEMQDTTSTLEMLHAWESWLLDEQTGQLVDTYEARWPHLKHQVDQLGPVLTRN